jgi:hypothetical protein
VTIFVFDPIVSPLILFDHNLFWPLLFLTNIIFDHYCFLPLLSLTINIEDLKFAYLTQVRRCDALTRAVYAHVPTDPERVMQQVEEEAGLEVELQRQGSVGRRQRWQQQQVQQQCSLGILLFFSGQLFPFLFFLTT